MLAVSDDVTELVETGGPFGLGFVMFLENVFPPIPSELVLPLAGFLVDQGTINPVTAVLAATLGSLLGAVVLYEAGRHGGRPLVLRYGKVLRVDEARLDRADDWMARHGTKVVLFARMVPLARSVVSVPAGTARMGRGQFLLYSTIGSAVWNSALIAAGWALGASFHRAESAAGVFGMIAAAVAVVVGLGLWWRSQRRSRMPNDIEVVPDP